MPSTTVSPHEAATVAFARALGAVAALTLLAGCGSGGAETTGDAATTEPAPSEPAASVPIPTAEPTEAVAEVYDAYWDAVVESENGPKPDPSLFDRIAVGRVVEQQMRRVTSMSDDGIRRVGRPHIETPSITIDGSTARVQACVDQDPWGAVVGGSTAPPTDFGPQPFVVDVDKTDAGWRVSSLIPPKEATITC